MKERLDVKLQKKGFTQTRSKARQLIKNGYVLVNGKINAKSGYLVDDEAEINVADSPFVYVSRSGIKLKGAIDGFNISVKHKICLDVGASTGGFCDCMLKEGAKQVYAVDVGSNQLYYTLKDNPKVVSLENTDIRNFETDVKFDFIAVDVSFISVLHILPHIKEFLKKDGEAVSLIKPQFEVGPGIVKKGIVKDAKLREEVVGNIVDFCSKIGFDVLGMLVSPIKGKNGNVEYLLHLKILEL